MSVNCILAIGALTASACLAWCNPGVSSVADVRRDCGKQSDRKVRLFGGVTLPQGVILDDPNVFYLQDETGGISVRGMGGEALHLGRRLEVTGTCALLESVEPEVTVTHHRDLGTAQVLLPKRITLEEALAGAFSGQFVAVEGTVRKVSSDTTRDAVTLCERHEALAVYIRRREDQPPVIPGMAPPGSFVEAVGILIPVSRKVQQLRLRRAADLSLIREPPPPYLPILTGAGLLAGLIGLAGMLWIYTLRRSIRSKTSQIQELLEQAQEASRLKSQLLANVSHEIRTPLHGVLGLQALLLETSLTQEQRENLRTAHNATLSLQNLLDDLLDLSKIEAGKLTLASEPFSPAGLLHECVSAFAARAREKQIELRAEVDGTVPNAAVADPYRLRQVMVNLISNAVKFTPLGEVVVSVSEVGRDDNAVRLRFSVRDSGIGIAPDQLPHVFDAFRQADGSINRRYGGTGLGLAIASRLASLMGSHLEAASELGKGSEFSLILQCSLTGVSELSGQCEAVAGQGAPLSILLVEDNPVNQLVAVRLLQKDGHQVSLASTGMEAVERFAGGNYDLILMDVQMPEMDGIEATMRIRRLEERSCRPRTPIVAVSAHSMRHEADRCFAAGMDDFVGKPFQYEDLRAAIRRCRQRQVEAANAVQPS